MSRRASFDKKQLKAAPTDNSFRQMILQVIRVREKPWLLAIWLVIVNQFKKYVFSFSFAKMGKC